MAKFEPSGNAPRETRANAAWAQAIVAEELACQRGGQVIVSGLSFEVRAGTALLLRGPNGSGKTTLLRTIAGFLQPAAGSVRVLESAAQAIDSAAPDIGSPDNCFHYIGHANGIKPRLSVIENISFWQRYYSGGNDLAAVEEAIDRMSLLHLADYSAAHLSQGQARRLSLARLLAAQRPIWLLDEPSASLDASSTRLLEAMVADHLKSGGLTVISTHSDLALEKAAVLELNRTSLPQ